MGVTGQGAMTRLRPLGVGEIVDHAAALWRAHWRGLFLLALPFQLLAYVLDKVTLLLGRAWFPSIRLGGMFDLGPTTTGRLDELAVSFAFLSATLLTTYFLSQLSGIAATAFLWPRVLEDRAGPSWTASLAFALGRALPAAAAFGQSLVWTLAVGLLALLPGGGLVWLGARPGDPSIALFVVGGLLLLVGVTGVTLWFILRFILVAQVLGVEGPSGRLAIRRAGELASGQVGPGLGGWVKARLTVLLTVVGGILLLVGVVSSAPLLALGVGYGAGFGPGRTVEEVVPQALLVPVQLLELTLGAVFSPLFDAFKVTFYADMRVRREGLDLEQML